MAGRKTDFDRSRLDAWASEPTALPGLPYPTNSVRDTQTGQGLVQRQAGDLACPWWRLRKVVIPGRARAGNGGEGVTVRILQGDALAMLKTLPDESVHCVVTSPPYWGLRDYGVAGQIGLESTPAEFLAKMVEVFREVRRVLRADGTAWVNMGDSYASAWVCNRRSEIGSGSLEKGKRADRPNRLGGGLKEKDLVGMPWRLAFALQDDGWYLRQDIIWHKPNPMPESVRDRCTKSHEYIFLLAKSERYFFDQDAICEPCSDGTHARLSQDVENQIGSARANGGAKTNGNMKAVGRHLPGNKTHRGADAYDDGDDHHRTKAGLVEYATRMRKLADAGSGTKNNTSFDAAMAVMPLTRNKRSVWTITTKGFSEAHFATFPPELPEICIKAGCPPDGTVLDPFFGAGTTGMVADRLGRNCIGIELNAEYAAMAKRRIVGDSPLFAEVAA